MSAWPAPTAPPEWQCRPAPPGFPTPEFVIDVGVPAIRFSAERYQAYARHCSAVAERFGSAAVSWVGPEGRLYEDRRVAYASSLRAASATFGEFHRHVTDFANAAESLHARITRTRHDAEAVWTALHPAAPTVTALGRDPFAVSTAAPDLAERTRLEAEFARLRAEARRHRAAFTDLARDIAARIGSLPAPTVPTTAEAHAAMPPLVVRRGTYTADVTGELTHALAALGVRAEIENLENGRVRVRLITEAEAGATAGWGLGMRIPGVLEADAEPFDAEAAIVARTGKSTEMDEADVPDFLRSVLTTGDTAPPTGRAPVTGELVEIGLRGRISGDLGVDHVGDVSAEGAADASLRGEVYSDSSWTVTVSGSVSGRAEAGLATIDDLDDDTREWLDQVGLDDVGRLPEEAGLGPAAVGAAASLAYAVNRRPDGSAVVTRTVRVEKEGEDVVHERRTARVVTAAEVDRISRDLREGNAKEAARAVVDIAGDVQSGSAAAAETQNLTYEVQTEDVEAGGGGSAGPKAELTGRAEQRTEVLTEVDGVRRGDDSSIVLPQNPGSGG